MDKILLSAVSLLLSLSVFAGPLDQNHADLIDFNPFGNGPNRVISFKCVEEGVSLKSCKTIGLHARIVGRDIKKNVFKFDSKHFKEVMKVLGTDFKPKTNGNMYIPVSGVIYEHLMDGKCCLGFAQAIAALFLGGPVDLMILPVTLTIGLAIKAEMTFKKWGLKRRLRKLKRNRNFKPLKLKSKATLEATVKAVGDKLMYQDIIDGYSPLYL